MISTWIRTLFDVVVHDDFVGLGLLPSSVGFMGLIFARSCSLFGVVVPGDNVLMASVVSCGLVNIGPMSSAVVCTSSKLGSSGSDRTASVGKTGKRTGLTPQKSTRGTMRIVRVSR